jgi:hypothetical protein
VLAVTRKKEGVDLAGQQPDGVAPLVNVGIERILAL